MWANPKKSPDNTKAITSCCCLFIYLPVMAFVTALFISFITLSVSSGFDFNLPPAANL
jgi:hypothetical protein